MLDGNAVKYIGEVIAILGYIRPNEPQLKIIEQQYYRAAYCGLCHALGDAGDQLSRLGLSYDFTLLVLFRFAVTGEKPEFEKSRCMVHPLKKRLTVKSCPSIDFAARAGIILAYRKVLDDIADERGLARQRAKAARAIFGGGYKKAKRAMPELDGFIGDKLKELSRLEGEGIPSVDIPARLFGQILGEIFAFGLDGGEEKLSRTFGESIGRWIYIIDALDDISEDREKGRYNPFLCLYGERELDTEKKKDIEAALISTLSEAAGALDLISLVGRDDLEGLLRNILWIGMPEKARLILWGESCNSGGPAKA